MGTMWYLSGSTNELDRKGIPRDNTDATKVEGKVIPKITN